MTAMADDGPVGGNPFEGIPLFKDLAGMFQQAGNLNFDIARQTGLWVATGGKSESNVDPVQRIRYEELFTIAALHVGEATGLVIEAAAAAVQIATRAEWAATALDAYRPILERLAEAVGNARRRPCRSATTADEIAGFLGGLGKMMSPVLIGMQAGVMVGQLAQRGLGPYDLPLPRPAGAPVQIVATNIDAFARGVEPADRRPAPVGARRRARVSRDPVGAAGARPHQRTRRRLRRRLQRRLVGHRRAPR